MPRNFFYCAELDPSLEPSAHRIEMSLKWSLLFSRQLVLSDVQLLYNPPFRSLIRDPKFEQLLESRDVKDRPHIVASLRSPHIQEIISEQIDAKHGGRHAIVFSFLNQRELEQIEPLRKKGKLTSDRFYDIAPEYLQHANELQRLFVDKKLYRESSKTPQEYARHVLAALDGVLEMSSSTPIRQVAERLRPMLFRGRELGEVYRRDLWRFVEKAKLNDFESNFIKKWILILPYNRNVAENEGFEMFYSCNLSQRGVHQALDRLPQYQSLGWEMDSQSFYDLDALAEAGRLDFAQIARIREHSDFEQSIAALEAALHFGKAREAKRALQGHITFLDRAIGFQVGGGLQPKVPYVVELLLRSSEKLVEHKYPFLKLFPFAQTFLSRITSHLALVIRSPRRRALQIVGESLVESAFKKRPEEKQ